MPIFAICQAALYIIKTCISNAPPIAVVEKQKNKTEVLVSLRVGQLTSTWNKSFFLIELTRHYYLNFLYRWVSTLTTFFWQRRKDIFYELLQVASQLTIWRNEVINTKTFEETIGNVEETF